MAECTAFALNKWSRAVAERLVQAAVRVSGAADHASRRAPVYVFAAYSRFEALLALHLLERDAGRPVWGLADASLFRGRVGAYLRAHALDVEEGPEAAAAFTRTLLSGERAWAAFPPNLRVRDPWQANPTRENAPEPVLNGGPPLWADLACKTAALQARLETAHAKEDAPALEAALAEAGLVSAEPALGRRIAAAPALLAYHPIKPRADVLLRMARRYAVDLNARALEEFPVEDSLLAPDTEIDLVIGEEVAAAGAAAPSEGSGALALARQCLRAIPAMLPIGPDHVMAGLMRYGRGSAFNEHVFRSRVHLVGKALHAGQRRRVHPRLRALWPAAVHDEAAPDLEDFLARAAKAGLIARESGLIRPLHPTPARRTREAVFLHAIPNALAPLADVVGRIRHVAHMPRFLVDRRVREAHIAEDQRCFETAYARYYAPGLSKDPEVGRPFLLRPWRPRAGIVLIHGYMAAPLEIRALAESLYRAGYAVYGVRLAGHGAAPEALAATTWEEWCAAVNRGYAVIRAITGAVYLGGFSTGGCLALIGAARKGDAVRGVFSICAPLQVRNYSIRLAPSIVSLNSLLKRIGRGRESWEFVENIPENKHINYTRNPLTGVRELVEVMGHTEALLERVTCPTLVVQASQDTTVSPVSGQMIFDRLGATRKELTLFERHRHGIVNGPGSEEVFACVAHFLDRIERDAASAGFHSLFLKI